MSPELRPRNPDLDPPEIWPAGDHPTRRCGNCQRPLPADAHWRRQYCGSRCRGRLNQRRWKARKRRSRPCRNCGGVFVPLRTEVAEYCSVICKKQASRRRMRARHRKRDRLRYQTDPEYRARKRLSASETYRKRQIRRAGSEAWARAQLEQFREASL